MLLLSCPLPAEIFADDLEEELDGAMLQDFNVEAEDNSPAQVVQASAGRSRLHLNPCTHLDFRFKMHRLLNGRRWLRL